MTPAIPRDWHRLAAIGLWLMFALAITAYVVLDGRRTVTPTYRIAGAAWFAGGRLYNDAADIGGFLYFPQAALLFAPFTALPHSVGEALWRLVGLALLASGLWRLAGLISAERRAWLFLLFTLLCLPATVSSARNGQMNLHMVGLMLHATADVAIGMWWRAALSLTIGLALKPHTIVMAALVAALHPRTRSWFVGWIVIAAAVPFLLQRPSYVVEQYVACFHRVVFATMPVTDTWSDLRGLLLRLDIQVSNERLIFLRLAAAVPTLWLAFIARRHGPAWSAVYLFALAAAYMMVFIPRTEANSYVILAPAVGAIAALAAAHGRTAAFWALIAFAVVLGCENYGRTIFLMTDLWLKPLLTIPFSLYVILLISRRPLLASGVG
jgi:hypothetical protein